MAAVKEYNDVQVMLDEGYDGVFFMTMVIRYPLMTAAMRLLENDCISLDDGRNGLHPSRWW